MESQATYDLELGARGQTGEVGVAVQERRVLSNTDRGDEAIDSPSDGHPCVARSPVQSGSSAEVIERFESNDRQNAESASEALGFHLVVQALKELRKHDVRQCDGRISLEEVEKRDNLGCATSSKEVDPDSRIDDDQRARLRRLSSRFPVHRTCP